MVCCRNGGRCCIYGVSYSDDFYYEVLLRFFFTWVVETFIILSLNDEIRNEEFGYGEAQSDRTGAICI